MFRIDSTPQFRVHVPARLNAWEQAEIKVTIRNVSSQPILPLLVQLSTAQGILEEWGVEGRIMRWGQKVRGRKTATGWEVLLGPELQMQQIAGPPSQLDRQATMDLVRLDPLMRGMSVELHTYFDAAYQHGDHLDATLLYITLDPKERLICIVTEKPSRLSLVACQPTSQLTRTQDADFYMPAEELERDRKTVQASASLKIRHPRFDIEPARSRAAIAEGPFGYDTKANRWVLVDTQQQRTLVVGATGPIEELPGDWLDKLITLNMAPAVTISWQARSHDEAERIRSSLEQANIEVKALTHKGYTSPTSLLVTLHRSNVSELARLMREMGMRLEGSHVISQSTRDSERK